MKFRQIVIFLGIFESILLVGHGLVYLVVVFLFQMNDHTARIWLAAALAFLSFSFILTTLLTQKNHSLLAKACYRLAASWMVIFYFVLVASTLAIVLYAILPLSPTGARELAVTLYMIAGLFSIYALYNAERIRIVRRTIHLPSVPEFWKDKNLVFISDIHLGDIHGKSYAERIARIISKLDTQAVLIGGDLFDGVGIDADDAVEPLHDIKTPLGTYFISGNHDEFSDPSEYFHAVRKSSIRILDSETVDLHGLHITGVDYLKTNKREKFNAVLQQLPAPVSPSILLKHVPSDLDLAQAKGFDASFSGHTHNGQLFPFGSIARRSYGFNYGLEMLQKMNVLVSSGVGTWGPPGRFGTKSEIVLVTFDIL